MEKSSMQTEQQRRTACVLLPPLVQPSMAQKPCSDGDSTPTAAAAPVAAAATTHHHVHQHPKTSHSLSRCSTRGRERLGKVSVGAYVAVYWPLDNAYYQARVVGAAAAASTSSSSADMFTLAYTDGSVETLNLRQEKFLLLEDESEFAKEEQQRCSSPARARKVAASSISTIDAKCNKQIGSRYDANVPKFSASSSELSDDVYLLILSCLTSLKDISALSRTCRRTHSLWKNGMHRERLLESLFRKRFGCDANACTFGGVLGPTNNSWQGIWGSMVDLKQALILQETPAFARDGFNKRTKEQMCQLIRTFTGRDGGGSDEDEVEEDKKLPASTSARTTGVKRKRTKRDRLRRTLGILSEMEEAEAIFYDNPSFAPESDARYCFGYFGMTSLNISIPTHLASTTTEENHGPPVAVWGDFPGCRIFHSPADVLYDPDTRQIRSFEAIADKDGEGLVLSALVCPFADELPTIDVEGKALRPVLFLGMSSGMVVSVGAGVGTGSNRATYGVINSTEAHESEVTSLVVIHTTGSRPESFMLASGSVDKHVKIYPSAFLADSAYSLGQSFTGCLSESLMFCLAATTVQQVGLTCTLIGAGDEQGFICFYASETDETKNHGFSFYSAGKSKFSQKEMIKPTRMKFLDDDILLAGSTHGDVKILQLRVREDFNRSSRIHASVVTLYRMPSAHVGTIEQIERFGDVLITSGGFDGQIKGWNFRTGRLLGSIVCHPGRHSAPETASMQPNRPIFSSVVGSVLFDDNTDGMSLLCLCRDGSLFDWKYEASRADASNGADSNDWLASLFRPATTKSAKAAGIKRQRKICMLADLNQVMTKTGRASVALQQRMRLEIFKSAVAVALQPDHKDVPFLGADGKVYESTKKAFSKYSGLQACTSCRSKAQGAFICRLIRAHELPAASLVEVKALLKMEEQRRKPAQDTASSLSVLECIERPKSPEKSLAADPENIEDEWQCHRCKTINDVDDKKCTSCWASKVDRAFAFSASPRRRRNI